jgi:hypothetical protein
MAIIGPSEDQFLEIMLFKIASDHSSVFFEWVPDRRLFNFESPKVPEFVEPADAERRPPGTAIITPFGSIMNVKAPILMGAAPKKPKTQ